MFVITATFQELFDVAVRGLATQKFQRSTAGSLCAYRGDNGHKCALGHLLSDEDMAQLEAGRYTVNTAPASSLRLKATGKHLFGDDARYRFIFHLQCAHDAGLDWANSPMQERLRNIAEEHNLNTAVLDEVTKP